MEGRANHGDARMNFAKMHGLGNDFMVIDGVTQNIYVNPEQIRHWADRHRGIGFDQLLLVEPPYDPDLDFHYRIFNAYVSEGEQFSNGALCLALFVKLNRLINHSKLRVITKADKVVQNYERDARITVEMLQPKFNAIDVPCIANKEELTYILHEQE